MSALDAVLQQEKSDLSSEERQIWSQCCSPGNLDESDVRAHLTQTQINQCIRGWQTESNRIEAIVTNIARIVEFKKKSQGKSAPYFESWSIFDLGC